MTKGNAERAQLLAIFFALASFLGIGVLGGNPRGTAEAAQKEAPPAKGKDPLLPMGPQDVNTGVTACLTCHNEACPTDKSPRDVKNNPFAKKFKSDEFVLLSEGQTWSRQDPHSATFKVLEKPLGEQMSRILGYDVTKASQCLTCHSIDKNPSEPDPLARFDRSEGVTCNACHGLRTPWQTAHYADKETGAGGRTIPWRTFTPDQKEQKGMRNLRDPVVKAQLCTNCHVGNPAEGKVVTHDMYAAGHPPLPPFELATFMECQPQHWGNPTNPELKFFTTAEFTAFAGAAFAKDHPNWMWELYRFHPEDQEVLLARSLAAGAVTSLQAEMRMIGTDAALVAKGGDGGVDFARFDCFACHHDLKSPSDRQARGYAGPPGRPPLKAWVGALPSVVVDHAIGLPKFMDLAKEFRPKWEAVQKAALARPFGKPAELAKAAQELDGWCDEFLKRLQNEAEPVYTTKDEAPRLLAAIGYAATSKQWTADPEAAMHLTWAYLTLRRQMKQDVPPDKLEALKKTIPIQVRVAPYSTETGEPHTVGDTLRQRLDVFRQYDSREFSKAFRDVIGGKGSPPK